MYGDSQKKFSDHLPIHARQPRAGTAKPGAKGAAKRERSDARGGRITGGGGRGGVREAVPGQPLGKTATLHPRQPAERVPLASTDIAFSYVLFRTMKVFIPSSRSNVVR